MSLNNHSYTQAGELSRAVYRFSVWAVADPGMMSSLMELWARRGLVPDRWYGVRDEVSGTYVDIDIKSSETEQAFAMRAIFCVSQFLTWEKRRSACA